MHEDVVPERNHQRFIGSMQCNTHQLLHLQLRALLITLRELWQRSLCSGWKLLALLVQQ